MGKTVTVWFAGQRPCKYCKSTTSVRGVRSITNEVSCASDLACRKRQNARVRRDAFDHAALHAAGYVAAANQMGRPIDPNELHASIMKLAPKKP